MVANTQYQRDIILKTNSYPETQLLTINILSGELEYLKIPYIKIFSLIPLSTIATYIVLYPYSQINDDISLLLLMSFLTGIIVTFLTSNKLGIDWKRIFLGGIRGAFLLIGGLSGFFLADNYTLLNRNADSNMILCGLIGATIPILTMNLVGKTKMSMEHQKQSTLTIYSILGLTLILGCSIGFMGFLGCNVKPDGYCSNNFVDNTLLIEAVRQSIIAAGFLLLGQVLYLSFKYYTIRKKYHSKTKLTKP